MGVWHPNHNSMLLSNQGRGTSWYIQLLWYKKARGRSWCKIQATVLCFNADTFFWIMFLYWNCIPLCATWSYTDGTMKHEKEMNCSVGKKSLPTSLLGANPAGCRFISLACKVWCRLWSASLTIVFQSTSFSLPISPASTHSPLHWGSAQFQPGYSQRQTGRGRRGGETWTAVRLCVGGGRVVEG